MDTVIRDAQTGLHRRIRQTIRHLRQKGRHGNKRQTGRHLRQ